MVFDICFASVAVLAILANTVNSWMHARVQIAMARADERHAEMVMAKIDAAVKGIDTSHIK